MEIEFVSPPRGDLVAWEVQFGEREGRYTVGTDGRVSYRHPADERVWHAGVSIEQFRACAQAWNTYVAEVKHIPEELAPAVVAKLHASLERAGVLRTPPSHWSMLLEQAENGFL